MLSSVNIKETTYFLVMGNANISYLLNMIDYFGFANMLNVRKMRSFSFFVQ